ncbi:hypothetical protein M405DRAFT_933771 [Rhizopogon salebrosus TDB-379]|nr:hypothetical protein M405DRAFT_933771 [Rhizopogon salebrosus TDB-379]
MGQHLTRFGSGTNWTERELTAHNISIVQKDERSFFGGPLPTYDGPAGFVQHEHPVAGLDESSLALIKRFWLAERVMPNGHESAVNAFTADILRTLDYETEETVICTQKNITLDICGRRDDMTVDVCIIDRDSKNILLVGQEDKLHSLPLMDPEPIMVAQMIAAFQANNRNRVNRQALGPLKSQALSGITMSGAFPWFYKARITSELAECVESGRYPHKATIIHRYIPHPLVPGDNCARGVLGDRILIVRSYQAFKRVVFRKRSKCPFFSVFVHN